MNDMNVDKTFTETHEMTGKCPFGGDRVGGAFGTPPTLETWYPARLRVELLHQNGLDADPLGRDFDYAAAFAKLDFQALKQDIKTFLTTPVAWWPADYNNYGPQMIRMAWHAAGTYRIADGRGGPGRRCSVLPRSAAGGITAIPTNRGAFCNPSSTNTAMRSRGVT